jgi:hypothetical protein
MLPDKCFALEAACICPLTLTVKKNTLFPNINLHPIYHVSLYPVGNAPPYRTRRHSYYTRDADRDKNLVRFGILGTKSFFRFGTSVQKSFLGTVHGTRVEKSSVQKVYRAYSLQWKRTIVTYSN